ncbi:hypothetical protein PDE_07978 [Penicillium oxalicum 114-2]|uniref:Calcium channel YVC1-like C-terminal transmembrane domain-containing protein n=1 Tax=Penicillium oxalicum (strain 114-2 / CGMCC 5302) TaxID=933388 RepID=S8BDF0_PENO1|nr:hypothetical protein PDE_07978 [Penicillium oxalicum 114-2]
MHGRHRESFGSDAASGAELDTESFDVPVIETDDPLFIVIPKLSYCIETAIGDIAYSFEQMRLDARGHSLRHLIRVLARDTHNPFIIIALMILRWDYSMTTEDDWGLNESRGAACEFVAWQFLCHLNQRETIEFLLEELPSSRRGSATFSEPETGLPSDLARASIESAPLLAGRPLRGRPDPKPVSYGSYCQNVNSHSGSQIDHADDCDMSRFSRFFGLNALEIASIAGAKRFLSQRVVQRVVNDIWNGEIMFWDSLTVHSMKKPQIFNRKTADPYSRLRVPLYRKMFEAGFFLSFLFLYYSVLVERKPDGLGSFEILMDVWIVAFAYDELSGFIDAGIMFYQMDFWSLWNLGIIGVGVGFIATRAVGLIKGNDFVLDLSFDILSLEALFLVPRSILTFGRICSLVSLNSYFGSLLISTLDSGVEGNGMSLTSPGLQP